MKIEVPWQSNDKRTHSNDKRNIGYIREDRGTLA